MSQAKTIKPTIGRRVWFWPGALQILIGDTPVSVAQDTTQPLDAGVAYVHSDRLINISFANQSGQMHSLTSVTLVQPGDELPAGPYCTWMDYQINAAAKEEPAATVTAPPPASDASIEAEIIAKGLTAPRVTPGQIDALMERVVYVEVQRPGDTTSTFVHAYLDGKFLLATGFSACVSVENFNADTGLRIAKGKAQAQARDKLWELEGYALFKALQATAEAQPASQAKAPPEQNYEGPDHGE